LDATPRPPPDPFGDTVNTALYVAREATEHSLAALVVCAREPARPAVLVGPPGIGKSLLLRLAEQRLEGIGPRVFLPYACLDPDGLCTWILDRLRSPRFEDPVFAFEAYLSHLREIGSGLLLLLDDFFTMPLETVRWLGRCALNSKGELRLIASALDDPRSHERIASLGPGCETILLESPMQPGESTEYVHERLRQAGAPEAARSRFDPATVAELHRLSEGNPRELNSTAARLLIALPTVRV